MYISENDKIVIRQLVEKQMQAFQENDEDTAFALTSPTIQQRFQPKDFVAKIAAKYNAIINPRSVMFRGFTLIEDFPGLVYMIMNQEGELTQGIFVMQHQPDYSWRIHGYELLAMDQKIM